MVNIGKSGGQPSPEFSGPPLEVGTIITQSLYLPFRHIDAVSLIGLIYVVIALGTMKLLFGSVAAFSDPETFQDPAAGQGSVFWARTGLAFIVNMIVTLYLFGALISHFTRASSGETARTADTVRAGLKSLVPLAVVSVLFALLVTAAMLVVVTLGLVIGQTITLILGLIAMCWVMACFAPVFALATEEGAMWSALRRAHSLTKGYRLPILGTALVISLVSGLALFAAGTLLTIPLYAADGAWFSIAEFINAALSVLATSVFAAFYAVIYVRLIGIKEGGAGSVAEIFR